MYPYDLSIETRVIIGISGMVLLFAGFMISYSTSQRKKLRYHKDLQRLNEEKHRSLEEQNTLLEKRVEERTLELQHQKDALQASLSELEATQLQLVQKEKMASLGELTAGIAHEIQNPLNFVNNFSEVSAELLDELTTEARAGNTAQVLELAADLLQNISKITHHGRRADSIVKNMLQHSRSSTGQKEPTDLNALADEYLRLAYHGLRAKDKSFNAILETSFDPALGKIAVVPQDVGRVFLNLFNNAFYTIQEKKHKLGEVFQPKVTVQTSRRNGVVEVRVLDNGMGVTKGVITKIFQPFFTTKPTGEGTGLGLSLSYEIITKGHGGEIKVNSTDGEGTEFVITFPGH
jgi:two-component system, NtrC family, sensor kinase